MKLKEYKQIAAELSKFSDSSVVDAVCKQYE
jgi:hypothetical protein